MLNIQVVEDNHKYQNCECPRCSSKLRIERDLKLATYRYGSYVYKFTCPCCGENVMVAAY